MSQLLISGDHPLMETVLIAYSDLNAASIRALLGLSEAYSVYSYNIEGISDNMQEACRPIRDSLASEHSPLEIFTLKDKNMSIILVNSIIEGCNCHYIVKSIIDRITKYNVVNIFLLSTILISDLLVVLRQTGKIYENSLNTVNMSTYPSLPPSVKIRDPFLNTFLQFCMVECVPLHCFIIPTYRCKESIPNEADESKKNIKTFQDALKSLLSIDFNFELSCQYTVRLSQDRQEDSLLYL